MVSKSGTLGARGWSLHSRSEESHGLHRRRVETKHPRFCAVCLSRRVYLISHFCDFRIYCWTTRKLGLFQDCADRSSGSYCIYSLRLTVSNCLSDKENRCGGYGQQREPSC